MASRGVNKVILVGNLGQDPEVRYMPSGGAVANLTLATSESWRDKQTGEMKEQTEWHRVVMFGKLAEVAGEYLRKGSQVYIEGQLRTRKWTDQSGQERYTTEITVPQIDTLVDIVKATIGDRGGLRMTGGGFGGCVVALIPEDLVPAVRQAVAQQYEAKTGIKETFYVCKPSQGAGQC